MIRPARAVTVLLLATALSGCTAGATTTTSDPGSSAVVVATQRGSDVGNDRPRVTYDGLMVRRRTVIAIRPTPKANLVRLRRELQNAAAQRHTTVSSISPDVLDPALLEQLVPEMTVVLPIGDTVADARKLIDLAGRRSRKAPGLEGYHVASVLVHDLRFTVRSAVPEVLASAIAREGILSDAMGTYTTTLGPGYLEVTYTGPLLSDSLVESIRGGIARRAETRTVDVIVSPRSRTGTGVDMAKEPALAPAVTEISTVHNHSPGHP